VIQILAHADGCLVLVRAQPGARRNGVVGEYNGALKIAVAAPPDKGKANDAIQAVLCDTLGLSRSQVTLVSGHSSREKRFLIRDMSADTLQQKLAALLKGA
jgi:uncharacterized protein